MKVPKRYSPDFIDRELERLSEYIDAAAEKYAIPSSVIKAILKKEMTEMDLLDPVADLAVKLGIAGKKDSSVGYAQIFGRVGLNAANYGVDHGLATYESLGIDADRRLDPQDPKDVRLVWQLLLDDPRINIELAALNLLAAAEEVVGKTEFELFSEEEIKKVLSRYNANVRTVTPYGEDAYRLAQEYKTEQAPGLCSEKPERVPDPRSGFGSGFHKGKGEKDK